MKVRRVMVVPGQQEERANPGCCAAVRGTTARAPADRRFVVGTIQTSGTAAAAFAWFTPRRGLFSPLLCLPSCPLHFLRILTTKSQRHKGVELRLYFGTKRGFEGMNS